MGSQVGALLLGCFADRPTAPPEGSAVSPSDRGSLPSTITHLEPQVRSFLLLHSHWLPFSAALERSLIVCLWAFPRTPISLSSLDVEVAAAYFHRAYLHVPALLLGVCCEIDEPQLLPLIGPLPGRDEAEEEEEEEEEERTTRKQREEQRTSGWRE
ncbi:hypothetical protein D5F01_LYC03357 [Larimichthys crocea]|uniref:Uncharacterized protein n=1 Tax=Larimichthys crocea TaxID=215358 RepID=A0A6G0J530_LARCR|nr:hypothetical protein D5F01_LYC03357 [Larimichthys crocea]